LYGIPEYQLQIFDRWGKLVYDKFGSQPSWNGLLKNGETSPTNSFAYVVRFETLSGKKITKKGVINLIR
jgi:gliding motility-associated-like protein